MRTTLDIDPVILQAAKAIATARSVSLGRAVSDLALEGLNARKLRITTRNGVPVLNAPPGSRPITLEDVKAALEDES